MKKIFFLFFLLSAGVYAQKTTLINSGDIINDGIKLHDDEEYELAIKKYDQVDRNDTNYVWALYEKAYSYSALKEYEKVIKIGEEGLKYESDYIIDFYNIVGSAYDELDMPEKSIETFKKGISYAPYNYLLYYNVAMTYFRLEEDDSAIVYAKKAIDCNIFHASSHYILGQIYADRQMYTQAMMCFQMFLLLEPNSKRSENALSLLLSTCQINEDKTPKKFTITKEDQIFNDLNVIIKSKVAINEKYKTPVKKIKDPLIKQMYVMIEKLETSNDISNFWHRNYTKFFKDIYKEGYFLPHTYLIISGLNSKNIQKVILKEKSKILDYEKWAENNLEEIRSHRYFCFNGKYQKIRATYNKNFINSLGEINDIHAKEPTFTGPCEFYYNNGVIMAKGAFNNKGEKTGTWNIFFPYGKKKNDRVYKDNELYETSDFYEDGTLKTHSIITGGLKDYCIKNYFPTGVLNSEENYVNDMRNGISTLFFETGEKKAEVNYKNDKELVYTNYFISGKIKSIYTANEDKTGKEIGYFENGKIEFQGDYFSDNKTGKWQWFFDDGAIKNIEYYDKEGNIKDTSYEYYQNGKLSSKVIYAKNKKNGICLNYDDDGLLYFEYFYKNNDPVYVKFYDKSGAVISSSEVKHNTLEIKYIYPTGEVNYTGQFENGKRDGLWKYYYKSGNLEKEENYSDGKLNGKIKGYFENGLLHYEYYMKNDMADGYFTKYYSNGNMELEGWYIKDKYEGYWYNYMPNGVVLSVDYYLHDNKNGFQQEFDNDGKLTTEEFYKDNLLQKTIFFDSLSVATDTVYLKSGNGNVKKYGSGKKLLMEYTFVNGLLNGPLLSYHANGQVFRNVEYARGLKSGFIKNFDHMGNLEFEGQYKDGERDGEWKWYNKNKLTNSGTYKNGDKIGSWKTFSDNGNVTDVEEYNEKGELMLKSIYAETGELAITKKFDHDILYAYTYFDKNNVYVPDILIKNGSGLVIAYYPNGKISIKQEFKCGAYIDTNYIYYPNGNIYKEIPFKYFNELDGLKKTYWPNGKIKSEESYLNDDLNGESKYYRQDGTIERTEIYKSGVHHGNITYYDTKGNIIKIEKYKEDIFYE